MEKWCKVCQYRAETAEDVCPECGAPLFEAPKEPEAAPTEEGGAAQRKKTFRRLHLPWGAAIALFLAVCLGLQGGLLRLLRPPKLRFVPVSENWCQLVQWPTGAAFITADNVTTIPAPAFSSSFSADRSRMLAMKWQSLEDQEGGCYLWDGQAAEKYAEPAALSGNGRYLFYQVGKDIFRKDLDAGTEEVVDQAVLLPEYPSLFSSWDGTAVAYYVEATEDKATVRLWTEKNGVEELELDGGVGSLTVGTQGKTLMVFRLLISSSFLSSSLPHDPQIIWRDTGRVTGLGMMYTCNRDGTEWIYTDEEGQLVYDTGEEPTPLDFHKELYLVRPENGAGIDHLANWFYLDGLFSGTDPSLYVLRDDLTLEVLAEKVEDVKVDAAGRWLYYVSKGNVYRVDDPMRPWRKTVRLTNLLTREGVVNAFSLDVASDGESMTYFTLADEESALGRMASDGTVWPGLDELPTSFATLNGGVMWAVTQEGALVYAKGDGEFQTVMEDPIFATRAILEASPYGDQAILTYISDAETGGAWRLTPDGETAELVMFSDERSPTEITIGTASLARDGMPWIWSDTIYGT